MSLSKRYFCYSNNCLHCSIVVVSWLVDKTTYNKSNLFIKVFNSRFLKTGLDVLRGRRRVLRGPQDGPHQRHRLGRGRQGTESWNGQYFRPVFKKSFINSFDFTSVKAVSTWLDFFAQGPVWPENWIKFSQNFGKSCRKILKYHHSWILKPKPPQKGENWLFKK